MNAKRKEAALKAIAANIENGATIQEIEAALNESDKKYTADEIAEIMTSLKDTEPAKADKPKPAAKAEGRPTFDKLICQERNITDERGEDPQNPKIVWHELYIIKNKRQNVKITQQNADELNQQAQNTLTLYMPSGSVKTGDRVILKVPKNRPVEVHEIIKGNN